MVVSGKVRRVEEGKRLRDRPFWKEEKPAGRWKKHRQDGTKKTPRLVGIARKQFPYLPLGPVRYFQSWASYFRNKISVDLVCCAGRIKR